MEDKDSKSALYHNIETKGEFSYYYAHGKRDKPTIEGKVIEGPGIITGGEPVLLDKRVTTVEAIKENKKFTKYIFYDDDFFVKIKIELPEELMDKVNIDFVKVDYNVRSLDLQVQVPDMETYFFVIKKLAEKIVPEESTVKVIKNKIILSLKKEEGDKEWEKLQA